MFTDLAPILDAFALTGQAQALPGGTTTTFRVGGAVLKRIGPTSLENDHSPELAAWIAEWSARLPQNGFRLAQPLRTRDGAYITPDGWTASAYLAGRHATPVDLPECSAAAAALHRAIAGLPPHPLMALNTTPWGIAQLGCLGQRPPGPSATRWQAGRAGLECLLDALYALRRPIPSAPAQLMHGDLNLENFLIAPGLPPAIIDFSPFWGPPELALAILANFSGPRRREPAGLRHFAHIPHFPQFLLRAAIRMLLVVQALDDFDAWDNSTEKYAAEQVILFMTT